MRREVKYPDTDVFKYYNANPKGRITSDCIARALSTVLGEDYNIVVRELAEVQCKQGYDSSSKECLAKYLETKGFIKMKQPRRVDRTKYSGREFCEALQNGDTHFNVDSDNKRILASIGGHHVVAIIHYKILDIWDSSNKCIGNYWVRG